MGFLCVNNEAEKNVSLVNLRKEEFLRDIGLTMVNNLNPEMNFCQEIFLSPEYYVTGATKLNTGLTTTLTACTTGATAIYNLDHTGDINLEFVFTGSTGFTSYDGTFCTKIFQKERWQPVAQTISTFNSGTELINSCLPFSAITGTSIVQTLSEGVLQKTWQEYLIRPYYTFKTKDCSPGIYFNSWGGTLQYNNFQTDTDYYFMTVIDPPIPVLQAPGTQGIPDYTLVSDRLLVDGYTATRGQQAINNDLNYFILTSIPANNQILLILNGIQLTQDYDYKLLNQGGYGTPPVVEIYEQLKPTDWLIATYIKTTANSWNTSILGAYFIDTIKLDGFTSTTTPSYRIVGDNTLNYNPTTLNYEFFTSLSIDPSYALIVTVNGVKLIEDTQFFKSTSFPGRIIFDRNNTSFSVGDIITVFGYTSAAGPDGNNYGSLKTNQFTAQWSASPTFTNDTVTGRFIVDVFDNTSGALSNNLVVDFIPGTANYEATFNNLSLNIYYKFRVTFEATYTGYLNNKVVTCSYSEGYFDTTNSYINNTY